ncbi:YgiQ family radical SAM protein ['Osedax' symbiont bacterium Rs2_46_30_T18]|nr:YgiQ family radical SAM protein ['Osedax' symbiont bacterium Rs2_46_30_T18]
MIRTAEYLFEHEAYWAECFGTADFLPTSRREMELLGWDSCDVILVTGDAYVDHPSFGMAVMGRSLEAQGFRVGIISQPDWQNTADFDILGKPNLYFGITAGNMDSMINRYTADLKVRHDDAYTIDGAEGKRPDRAVIVYAQRCRELYKDVPVVIGGIEASLRRIAQYDYWSNKVRRSVLIDSGADILLYGNAERAIIDVTHALANGANIKDLTDLRGTVVLRDVLPGGYIEVDSSRIDWSSSVEEIPSPYDYIEDKEKCASSKSTEPAEAVAVPIRIIPEPLKGKQRLDKDTTYIRLPSYEKVSKDSALYAHASRVLHLESNPHNAKVLVQRHGNQEIWANPPPIPLTTKEMDAVFGLPYQRIPHPSYGNRKIPAYDMIRFSVNIMRGCFGGCTFCSITEHEGRVIQSRSRESVIKEIEEIRDKVPGFTGMISDLGGPTSNMFHLNCVSDEIQSSCRKLSCVYPVICHNLKTDHSETTQLYREARKIPGVHKIAIASGLRYDLAVEDPEYVKELVTHHVGGYLKIAPEHSEEKTLNKMMKPGMGTYDKFKRMFDKYSKEAGKKQYLIPYFIAAHPGCEDDDMLSLSLWLKKNKFRVDQVQTFYPSPMSLATAMYHSGRNPLKKVTYKSEKLYVPRELEERRTQKALLRYHDEENWDRLRGVLTDMGRDDLIGTADWQLVPAAEKKKGFRYVQKSKLTGGVNAKQATAKNAADTAKAEKSAAPKVRNSGGKVIARASANARKKSSAKKSTRKKSIKRS